MNRIVNYTIPYRPQKLTEFLRLGCGMERFYFESSQSAAAIAGLGIAAQISRNGLGRFSNLAAAHFSIKSRGASGTPFHQPRSCCRAMR